MKKNIAKAIFIGYVVAAVVFMAFITRNAYKEEQRQEEVKIRSAEIAEYQRGFKDGMNATLKQMPEGTKVELMDILGEMDCFKD